MVLDDVLAELKERGDITDAGIQAIQVWRDEAREQIWATTGRIRDNLDSFDAMKL